MTPAEALSLAAERWPDQRSRLAGGFYYIKDKSGQKVKFCMNAAQAHFYDNRHTLNVILKARQLGFTTLIQLIELDDCLFRPNTSAGVIAQTLDDAKAFFNDKMKFAYDNLPDIFRGYRTATSDNVREYSFNNGSKLRVGVSLRSGTFQHLHVSEFGKICAKTPEKAREIVTGAFNTVAAGQCIDVESTAEGQAGKFYEMCMEAKRLKDSGAALTELDFKFHFYPWHEDSSYTLNPDGVVIDQKMVIYFSDLKTKHGVELTDGQKAWYVKKYATQKDEMKREYPSTPEEAFEAAIEGSYYHHELTGLRERRQIRNIDFNPKYAVSTFWDIGTNDKTVIWFYQNVNGRHVFVDYYEHAHRGIDHYADILRERGDELNYRYDIHYLPHDGGRMSWSTGEERHKTLERLTGIKVRVIERISDKLTGIQAVRNILPVCHFDDERCFTGLSHLQAYRKEYDDKRGAWKSTPFHGDESNGADGFRTFAEANSKGFIVSAHDYHDWGDEDYREEMRDETTGY